MPITILQQDKLNKLQHYVKMQTEEDIKNFEFIVWELAESKDLDVLKELIDLFDDDCEFYEVMYSLVHAIETYPNEEYISILLYKAKDLKKYPEWFSRLIFRIINHKGCFELFKKKLKEVDREDALELLEYLYKGSEYHRESISALKNQLD